MTIPSLFIISEQFFKWPANYKALGPLLNESRTSSAFAKLIHVRGSAHLSQSDFQLLFPGICRRYFQAKADAAKVMKINIRAAKAFLRVIGVEGFNVEIDHFFEEKSDAWEELEMEIEYPNEVDLDTACPESREGIRTVA